MAAQNTAAVLVVVDDQGHEAREIMLDAARAFILGGHANAETEGRSLAGFAFDLDAPPMRSLRSLQMASPSPVPPYSLAVELSAWLKDLKSRSRLWADMPMPVSLTENWIS